MPTATSRFAAFLLAFIALKTETACSEDSLDFFEGQIRPLLAQHCYECHGPDSGEGEGDLRLDSLQGMLTGGRSGPAIVRGNAESSLLMLVLRHDPAVTAMPPQAKLRPQELKDLSSWIQAGAAWPQQDAALRSTQKLSDKFEISEEDRLFWAFQPVQRPDLPNVRDLAWIRSPLDHFVLTKLETQGLRPAPATDHTTLLRRATIDLHGLLPSPAEAGEAAQDESPDAFERQLDRLLASPRYGERWGRHWLDVARYADSNGMDDNMAYADAWRYRDYVIAAFNEDKPYAAFVREQIAGDLLETEHQTSWHNQHDGKVATGFLMLGPKMLAEDDPVKQQMDIIDDQIDTVGRSFLGLSLGCARCHDHKFDPISIDDYYALAGIFKSTRIMLSYRVDSKWNSRVLGNFDDERHLEELEKQFDHWDRRLILGDFVGKEKEKQHVSEQRSAALAAYAAIPKLMAVEDDEITDLEIFLRGNHLTRGQRVGRNVPQIIRGTSPPQFSQENSGRLAMADWLTSPEHPLTARVMANRIWHHHFGNGIVRTVDNFGRLGDRPDHPALLDWLAVTFSLNDPTFPPDSAMAWSVKRMHRKIMNSATYRMGSHFQADAFSIDPENRLLWRHTRRRMEAEVIRDSLLQVGELLDTSIGGPAFEDMVFAIFSSAKLKDERWINSLRRSVYLPVLRSGVFDEFQVFDFPDPAVVNGRRATTTIASQALLMMNSELMERTSHSMAARIMNFSSLDHERLDFAARITSGRSLDSQTQQEFLDYHRRLLGEVTPISEAAAWQSICRILLSSNNFIYVE
ncbi:MAG: PSD1 and planctomycete cytochrome C domain-containing protein [Pirellulaceae bacterium]|nr:PSD1 and planctomycete cytochrome C domain-containing protein [Pirellulaceae bacterium]